LTPSKGRAQANDAGARSTDASGEGGSVDDRRGGGSAARVGDEDLAAPDDPGTGDDESEGTGECVEDDEDAPEDMTEAVVASPSVADMDGGGGDAVADE
jgi:hypothetical protein